MVYGSEHEELVIDVMMELGQTDRANATRAIGELRRREAFARELEIPKAAFVKSLELMQRAGLADDAVIAAAPAVIDDDFRREALEQLSKTA